MNIVVCMKQVPDTSNVKIDSKTNNLVREGVPSIVNPSDSEALEMALRLRDEHGGKVTVISMGPPQAAAALQECLDIGADRAILLSDRAFAGSDTLATGYVLSGVIAALGFDYVLCGAEAIDGCTGQVGPIIAENLHVAQFTYVTKAERHGATLRVEKNIGKYIECCETDGKAVVCVLKGSVAVRSATPCARKPEVRSAADFPALDADRLGSSGSPTRVVTIHMSDGGQQCYVMIDDTLCAKERIRMIMAGGIPPREKVALTRGTGEHLAEKLLELPIVKKYV